MKIKKIIEELKNENCILFVGPEIVKKDGKDIQEIFFNNLDNELKIQATYDAKEKLWLFSNTKTRRKITKLLADFYIESNMPHIYFYQGL